MIGIQCNAWWESIVSDCLYMSDEWSIYASSMYSWCFFSKNVALYVRQFCWKRSHWSHLYFQAIAMFQPIFTWSIHDNPIQTTATSQEWLNCDKQHHGTSWRPSKRSLSEKFGIIKWTKSHYAVVLCFFLSIHLGCGITNIAQHHQRWALSTKMRLWQSFCSPKRQKKKITVLWTITGSSTFLFCSKCVQNISKCFVI